MFKRLASEALGLSDVGVIVPASDFDKVDADDYLFNEDGERIFFLIKSKKDEYCFTNLAVVHVDGDSAISSKRTIKRFEFATDFVDNVTIETAGTIDLDIELKFSIGGVVFSIDIRKTFLPQLRSIYKALIGISRIQGKQEVARQNAVTCLHGVTSMFKLGAAENEEVVIKHYQSLLSNLNNMTLNVYAKRDYSEVFQKYLVGNGQAPVK